MPAAEYFDHTGSTRAMLYRVAAMTGLRASELASLTPASFDFAADVPTVTLEAAYSKHRREDVLPLHPDLANRLRQWLTERERAQDDQRTVLAFDRAADAKLERLFPGTWSERAYKMLRNDLEAAGISYVTADGIADFHSLRHTFISNLAACGIHPKLAQQLARHSTIALTMDRYTHLGLIDMNSALESLPNIISPESQVMRATGTTDEASDFGCTNGCTRPAEITPFQPLSTASPVQSETTPEMQKTPQKQEVFTEFSEVRPEGVEPPTFGSEVRRNIHRTNEAATSCEAAFAPWQFWWQ